MSEEKATPRSRKLKMHTQSGHPLTDREAAFIDLYLQYNIKEKAAKEAGYKGSKAGFQVFNKPYVKEEIQLRKLQAVEAINIERKQEEQAHEIEAEQEIETAQAIEAEQIEVEEEQDKQEEETDSSQNAENCAESEETAGSEEEHTESVKQQDSAKEDKTGGKEKITKASIVIDDLYRTLYEISQGLVKDQFGLDLAPEVKMKATVELLKRLDDIDKPDNRFGSNQLTLKIVRDYKKGAQNESN